MQPVYIATCRDHWNRFEASAGLVAAFVLAYGPLTCATLVLIFAVLLAEWNAAGIAATIVLVSGPMAVWLAQMAGCAMKQYRSHSVLPSDLSAGACQFQHDERPARIPFAFYLAANLPKLPRIVRVPLSLWWLVHFAAGTLLVEFGDVLAREGIIWNGLTDGIAGVVYGYLFHFAANIFLVLAVASLFKSQAAAVSVWRKRFAIDALFVCPLLLRVMVL